MSRVNLRTEPPMPPLVPPTEPPISPVDVETLVPKPAQSPEHIAPTPKHDIDLDKIPLRLVSPINIGSDMDSLERTVSRFEQ